MTEKFENWPNKIGQHNQRIDNVFVDFSKQRYSQLWLR